MAAPGTTHRREPVNRCRLANQYRPGYRAASATSWQAIGEARRNGTLPPNPHAPSQAAGEFIVRV
jgi:hypothetical protein